MAKDGDNTILIIGGLAVAAFFLLNKKSSPVANNAYVPYRPTTGGYGYANQPSSTGQIIQGAGSAIADIINAIKGKGSNTASNNTNNYYEPDGSFNYDQWSNDVSSPGFWDSYYGGGYYA